MAPLTELTEVQELHKDLKEIQILLQAILRNMNVACDVKRTDCNEESSKELSNELSLDIKIATILKRIGIPAHLAGYAYVKTAISMCLNNPSSVQHVTKELYPGIARQYNTSPSRVERAIRHAIGVGFNRGDIDFINEIFSFTISTSSGRPTNSEFIAMVADFINLN